MLKGFKRILVMSQKLKLIISEHGGEHTIGYMDERIALYWLENHERGAFENCLFDREKLDWVNNQGCC